MPAIIAKVIVTNYTAMRRKGYTESALKSVQTALGKLIKADIANGITTTVVDLSDKADMDRYKASVVTSEKDDKQNKDAIDAVFKSDKPAYLMILGSRDVVPQQLLKNPVKDSSDVTVPSDLPYACETTYDAGAQEARNFIAPSRVVGRLPDITGQSDPAYLSGLIESAADADSLPRRYYETYFALSAKVWQGSTEKNLKELFGKSTDLHLVPPKKSPWSKKDLPARTHFVNCHGGARDPKWYGEGDGGYPVALASSDVDLGISPGTMVAAECCYGADLYQPDEKTPLSLCNMYLSRGATLFFASSNVAYGPKDGLNYADLITQFVIREALKGESSGYATLKARQDYVKLRTTLNAVHLKTLAQFNLHGDPSLRPVHPGLPATEVDEAASMAERRREALLVARMLERNVSVPIPIPDSERGSELDARLREIGEAYGLTSPIISSFSNVVRGDDGLLDAVGRPPRQHLLYGQRDPAAPVQTDVIVIVQEQDGTIVAIDEVQAR